MPRKPRSVGTRAPSASDLTAKEAKLVALVIEAAAEAKRFPTRQELGTKAGYGVGETARVQASRALRRPHVREAIRDGLHENAGVDAARSYAVLRIATETAPSARDRITAASKIMDMAGIVSGPPMAHAPMIQFVFSHIKPEDCQILKHSTPEQRANIIFREPDEPHAQSIDHQPEEA